MERDKKRRIHIVGIGGSVRPGNYTSKALNLVFDELQRYPDCSCEVIDPAELHLPFPGGVDEHGDGAKIQERVSGATGIILSTPEYHGGYSSTIKLVIENLGFPSVLAGKPVALLGVAAGRIGAIKSLESLRSVASHVGAIVIPGPVSVAGVQRVFNEEGRCLDEGMEKTIRNLGINLLHYIQDSICPRIALEAMVRN